MTHFFVSIVRKISPSSHYDLEYLCRGTQHLKELYDEALSATDVLSRKGGNGPVKAYTVDPAPVDRSHPLDFQTLFLAGMALGGDFRKVLVHTGPEADEKARSIGAEAFTSGQDIYFREGQYDPESGEGRKRLIHELTHTSQFAEQRDMGFREDRAVLEEEAALREAQIDEAGLHRMELDEWVSGCDEEELIRVIGREGQIYLFTEEELEEVKEEALERIADWISSEWFTFDEKKKIRIMDYLYGNRWY